MAHSRYQPRRGSAHHKRSGPRLDWFPISSAGNKDRRRHRHTRTQDGNVSRLFQPPRFTVREIGIGRLALSALILSALVVVAFKIVVDTASQRLAIKAPDQALSWDADNSTALDQAARQQLFTSTPDAEAAEGLAQRALRAAPLNDDALFLLGVIAQQRDDAAKARALIQMAGKRTWRNLVTQLWLFEHDTSRKNFSDALVHADAMLRVSPEIQGKLFPALATFTSTADSLRALTGFLATNPEWRPAFLATLSSRLKDKDQLDRLYSSLQASRFPPDRQEMSFYIRRLVNDGQYRAAYAAWYESLPSPKPIKGAFPYNGNFQHPAGGSPFNWAIQHVRGADIAIVGAEGGQGKELQLQFSGARVALSNVKQLILLRPGSYRLSVEVKADNLQTTRGLWWRLTCVTGNKADLAQTPLVHRSGPWEDFGVQFRVPKTCEAQQLALELPGRAPSEMRIEGVVSYRDIQIQRLTSAEPASTEHSDR